MSTRTIVQLLLLAVSGAVCSAEPPPIIDMLRAADIREQQLPGGGTVGSNHPLPTIITATAESLQQQGRLADLAHGLEFDQALRSDQVLFDFGVAVLVRARVQAPGEPWPGLGDPAQVSFILRFLCEESSWRRLVPAAPGVPSAHRAAAASAIIDCLQDADYEKAVALLRAATRLDRASNETNAALRALVSRAPGHFIDMWSRVPVVQPASLPDREPEKQPIEVQLGSSERAVRLYSAHALFATTLDLAGDLAWVEMLQGESRTAALGGMMLALPRTQFRRSPFVEADDAVKRQYLAVLTDAAGNQELAGLWKCCLHLAINGVVNDPVFSSQVRAEAARTTAAIHSAHPETADKAAWYVQKAQELDPQ